jgi:hypothetical protein
MTAPITPSRAVFFLERFKKEEKMLGPNEQAALNFAIDQLQAMAEARQGSGEPVAEDRAALARLLVGISRATGLSADDRKTLSFAAELVAAPPSAQQATGSGQGLTDVQIDSLVPVLPSGYRPSANSSMVFTTSQLLAHTRAAVRQALKAATKAQPEEAEAAYHAWAGSVDDEVALRKAVSVCDDVLTDIADWEDKALAEAVTSVREELAAMADRIKEDGTQAQPEVPAGMYLISEDQLAQLEMAADGMDAIANKMMPPIDEVIRPVRTINDAARLAKIAGNRVHNVVSCLDLNDKARALTAPTTGKREPLSDPEIDEGWQALIVSPRRAPMSLFKHGVRFAEKRHGITGEQ